MQGMRSLACGMENYGVFEFCLSKKRPWASCAGFMTLRLVTFWCWMYCLGLFLPETDFHIDV